jgi:hypothetical protein
VPFRAASDVTAGSCPELSGAGSFDATIATGSAVVRICIPSTGIGNGDVITASPDVN